MIALSGTFQRVSHAIKQRPRRTAGLIRPEAVIVRLAARDNDPALPAVGLSRVS
jgi:hypothetical protein